MTWANELSPGLAVARVDNELLVEFKQRVHAETKAKGASFKQLSELAGHVTVIEKQWGARLAMAKLQQRNMQAELDDARRQLASREACETGRNLRCLGIITRALQLIRNFT